MAATFTASITPRLRLLISDTPISSYSTQTTTAKQLQMPDGDTAISFANGTGAAQISAGGFGSASLASTTMTIDLTSIVSTVTNFEGTSPSSKIKLLAIYNAATAGTNKPLIVGNAAANAFTGPMGGTTPTEQIEAGCWLVWENLESAGWAHSSNKNLKLNSGSNTVPFVIVVAGN